MVGHDDWRLQGQERFLKGKTLYWRRYKAYSETWEHDHCAFCGEKLAEGDNPNALHEGYATKDNYFWVCKQCFYDFREMFEWKVGS
jgi:hypothetical protein